MEATKEMLQSAIATLRTVAVEAAKVTADGAPLADQKKEYSSAVRNAVARVVALAHLLSAGKETVAKMIGAATLKASGDVLKVRLSEANKIRKLHPRMTELAGMWAEGTAEAFDPEAGGYSVSQALKDVTVPSDPIGAVCKAVLKALEAGEAIAELNDRVAVTIRQYEVEQEFLAEQEQDSEQQQAA